MHNNYMINRILVVILSILMTLGTVPISSFAEEVPNEPLTEAETVEKETETAETENTDTEKDTVSEKVQDKEDEEEAEPEDKDNKEVSEEKTSEEKEDTSEENTQKEEYAHSLNYEGDTYSISIECKDASKIPSDAVLDVQEIKEDDEKYTEYLTRANDETETASPKFIKLLDITIVDKNNTSIHYQPDADVKVNISLRKAKKPEDGFKVVHFDDTNGKENTEELEADTKGREVTFETGGFSAYAILEAPAPISTGISKVTSMEELEEELSNGIYIGNTAGYYMRNEPYNVNNSSRTGILKTALGADPQAAAALYYFEKVPNTTNKYYIYFYNPQNVKTYLKNSNNNSLAMSTTPQTQFTVELNANNVFVIHNGSWYINMQGGVNGKGFCCYNAVNDVNNNMYFWKHTAIDEDVYEFGGKAYGLVRYNGSSKGKALSSEHNGNDALKATMMNVMFNENDRSDKLYVPNGSDIPIWEFEWVSADHYYVKINGEYLNISSTGTTTSSTPQEIQIIPGAGEYAGKISLKAGSNYVSYAGSIEAGFTSSTTYDDKIWLCIVEESELTEDYKTTYNANKVSVSDTRNVPDQSKIIIYTRVWNSSTKKYDFYAIDHDGSLVPCTDNGDSIQWIGSAINTLLWTFTEYHNSDGVTPSYYYELQNDYSGQYLAPQITGNQILSDSPIGVNLNGRRYHEYYTSIIAWDDPQYTYAALHTGQGTLSADSIVRSSDFYFALMTDIDNDCQTSEVNTIDHTQYGITMKLVNFDTNAGQNSLLGSSTGGATTKTVPNLLSSSIDPSTGYPVATNTNRSFGELFQNAEEVNHLFIESTYNSTGYYEFDSTQNFASLQPDKNFKVFKELGTAEGSSRPSLQHGQFLPYNTITPGVFSTSNPQNLYTATLEELDEGDPRKYEPLYRVDNPDYYFGMEISASFVQTPSGLDAWGHDIIYEFTGDDDFWLYVDGKLIVDLGGIHSALPGSVNYSTGEVNVNGTPTTLYNLFKNIYKKENPSATTAEINEYLDGIFDRNSEGNYIFKDYTTHEMKIYFMERGAGASNLHMKFNLSSVKSGQVILNKQISGTDNSDYRLSEYGYQIWYQIDPDEPFHLLDQLDAHSNITVMYQNTDTPAKFRPHYTPPGSTQTYDNVFFLSPSQTVVITVPDETIQYKIVEVGVNTQVYDQVKVNDAVIEGVEADVNRKDYSTAEARVYERQRVMFENHVSTNAKRTLTITKKLYDIHDNLITDDPTGFNLRLYLGNENDTDPTPANTVDYHVKDPNGNYCRWNPSIQGFTSLNKTNYEDLTTQEKELATFQTSPNGSISKIPAEYKVEVRDLLIGTKFKVEERGYEIPDGYAFIKYEREGTSYIVEGDTVDSGTIRNNDSPAIEVRNRRGFTFKINKQWSDSSYMASHDDIYFAMYADGALVPGSIRRMSSSESQKSWYYDDLESGLTIGDYHPMEVELTGTYTVDQDTGVVTPGAGTTVSPVADGEMLTIGATPKDGQRTQYSYTATYTRGLVSGHANNVRTDTVTNSRHGIKLVKQDMNGNPLGGATFTIKDANGGTVGSDSYTSAVNGEITIAYINVNTVYTLTETRSPAGYQGIQTPIKFRLLNNGSVEVTQGDSTYYTVTQQSGSTMAQIAIKNRPYEFRVKKYGNENDVLTELPGAHFELHKEVTVGGVKTMDYDPMSGYEDLVSGNNGIIPELDNTLQPNTYYIKENLAPSGYNPIAGYVKFTLSPTGIITVVTRDDMEFSENTGLNGETIYTIAIENELGIVAPTGHKDNATPFWILILTSISAVYVQKKKWPMLLEQIAMKHMGKKIGK